jgi:hypothetical protein
MAPAEVTEAANLGPGLYRTGDDSLQRTADLMRQSFDHGVSRFAERDNQHLRIRMQVVKIFTDSQQPAFAMHMPGKTPVD